MEKVGIRTFDEEIREFHPRWEGQHGVRITHAPQHDAKQERVGWSYVSAMKDKMLQNNRKRYQMGNLDKVDGKIHPYRGAKAQMRCKALRGSPATIPRVEIQ